MFRRRCGGKCHQSRSAARRRASARIPVSDCERDSSRCGPVLLRAPTKPRQTRISPVDCRSPARRRATRKYPVDVRIGHGRGKGSPRIEVLPVDEQPMGDLTPTGRLPSVQAGRSGRANGGETGQHSGRELSGGASEDQRRCGSAGIGDLDKNRPPKRDACSRSYAS